MMSLPTLTAPTFEQHASGFGIGVASPRLSWRFVVQDDTPQGWEQTGYELEVVRSTAAANEVETYQVQDSSTSVLVPWPSTPLRSREQARVRVRVTGGGAGGTVLSKGPTDWSPWAVVEAGFLDKAEWTGRPITSSTRLEADADVKGPLRPIRFRRTFVAPAAAIVKERARLYITSLGVYKAYINGQAVGDHEMAPGWTSYAHRLNYQVFDVAALLRPGQDNVVAVEVAEGWYAGRLGFHGGRRYIYGDEIGVLAQLEVGSADGLTIVTDSSWQCQASALIRSEIYDGEEYDVGAETEWDEPTASSSGWLPVKELAMPKAQLVAADAPPVRVVEEVKPVAVMTTPSGKTVIDFGQNLVGRLRVRGLNGPRGQRVTFAHAEVLENGELGVRPLRVAKCRDTVVLAGERLAKWTPRFTFHGFRYVQVDGWQVPEGDEGLDMIRAQVMHTDLQRTGHFSCSHALVNRLHENAWWSMRGNFLSIPTDCPQRDERLGWTGDIQVFAPSASFLCNTAGMLGDWLRDLMAEQLDEPDTDGVPPLVVPNVIQGIFPALPQAIWDDVAVLTPWVLYRYSGDTAVLQRQYPSMLAWLDRGVRRGPDRLWDPDLWQLGDWLDPTAPPDNPADARTSSTLVADAYLVHVTSVMADIAAVVGGSEQDADAQRFWSDAADLRATWQHKYVTPAGLVVGDTQTALALALVFELLPTTAQAAMAGSRLARLVRQAGFRVATGFAGTPVVTEALTRAGHHQLAYRMLQEGERPSWLYPVRMGATTVWERWDSMLPDGSINPGEMTSFNHYALGSVVQWLHETVAGLRPLAPGWKTFRVAPLPGGTINTATASFESVYGRIEVRWTIQDDRFCLDLLVPVNSRAQVVLPGGDPDNGIWLGSGRYHLTDHWDNTKDWPPTSLVFPPIADGKDTFV
ncbi:alpha-l-rhamnosidase [Grosmannia clavigera kw1407]|uniref:alpha-L-rhamnosidase n=1 Tax=Grosmannia clavigera (strain kw1407 / UAMH 11150) TaxID=655863 RepID=F0XPG6_GROCL|nr:alpha-l-rhamnosidase [Grosmannia clavigera kw1407]EFX00699.1 alpha-l-rhamnosidase [Grosmannia clavigera kw1407]